MTVIRELRNHVAHNVVELIQHHLHPSALQLANESPSEACKWFPRNFKRRCELYIRNLIVQIAVAKNNQGYRSIGNATRCNCIHKPQTEAAYNDDINLLRLRPSIWSTVQHNIPRYPQVSQDIPTNIQRANYMQLRHWRQSPWQQHWRGTSRWRFWAPTT